MTRLPPPQTVRCDTPDGARLSADLWKGGPHALLLAHGKMFDRASWSAQIPALLNHGLTILAPDFRGHGASTGPEDPDAHAIDIAAGVGFLRAGGARSVSILGGSMGAMAAAESVVTGMVSGLHALILLAPRRISEPAALEAERIAFIVADEDDAAEAVMMQRALSGNSELTVYTGDWHAQHLFDSPHAPALMARILDLLPGGQA